MKCQWLCYFTVYTEIPKSVLTLLEELAFGSTGITDNANIDVSSQGRSLHGGLGDTPEKHEQYPTLDFIIPYK